nr:unnamed protein product [Spirometra erinaceieuropaei]
MSATASLPSTCQLTGSDSDWGLIMGRESEVDDSAHFRRYKHSEVLEAITVRLKPWLGRLSAGEIIWTSQSAQCCVCLSGVAAGGLKVRLQWLLLHVALWPSRYVGSEPDVGGTPRCGSGRANHPIVVGKVERSEVDYVKKKKKKEKKKKKKKKKKKTKKMKKGSPGTGSQATVHSAEQFLDKIGAVTIEPNERMVSFGVVSLFPSIPQVLVVETLSDLLRQNYDGGDGQSTAQDLIELMGHCFKTFLAFEGITCEQIKGTPMGSPISGLIAEAALQKLERRLFEEYKPKFWAGYVDGTFVIIDRDKIDYYAELLNSIILDLQFTMEGEVGGKLPFLHVLVCRQPNGQLATSVYRKPLQMLSYNSNHPLQHKRSCVRTPYRRVETHCSTPAAKLDEIKLLHELLSQRPFAGIH